MEFQQLQAGLSQVKNSTDASLIPDLLRLALAQRRPDYLVLAEHCCQRLTRDAPARQEIWQRLRESYPYLQECLFADAPQIRTAAARLLSAFADPAGRNAPAIAQALQRETNPTAAAAILASLHSLRRHEATWPADLLVYQSGPHHDCVRFQAACCHLDAGDTVPPGVVAELARQLYGADGQALPSLRAIAVYASALPRPAAVDLWSGLLPAAEEFDGAAEIAGHMLRAATGDRRDGWQRPRLTSRLHTGEEAPPPGVITAVARLAYAGLVQKLTGRKVFLPLPAGQIPAREYPGVRAFPPAVDLQDPLLRRCLQAAVACEPLWTGKTDLWRLFGLPERRLEISLLLDGERERP